VTPPDQSPPPPPLDALWASESTSGRERRPRKHGLTVDRVVSAAIEIADADGLAALSMGRIAEHLGFSTMSLYRHVRNKDELVALMVDAAVEAPDSADDAEPSGWREALERWSWDLLDVVRRHPWLLEVQLPRQPFGPRRLVWLERGLGAMAQTEIPEDSKAQIILLLNGYVFSEARTAAEVEPPESEEEAEVAAVDHESAIAALVDADRFPALRNALDAGVFDSPGPGRDDDFTFGLALILDGVERLIERGGGA
jgi:AcrR family transcriptional regulator